MAPEPDRVIDSEPDANALEAIVVGVAVKLAKVPPTAATVTTETAAKVSRIFVRGRFLSIVRVSPFEWLTRRASDPPEWVRGPVRNEFGRSLDRAKAALSRGTGTAASRGTCAGRARALSHGSRLATLVVRGR